jgi:hypothetical protein
MNMTNTANSAPTQQYCDFIDELCKLVKLGNASAMHEFADLTVDGVDFTLSESMRGEQVGVSVQCDYGTPPMTKHLDVLERLLEMNQAMYGPEAMVFGLHAGSGHVVLNTRLGFAHEDIKPLDLLNIMGQMAASAKEWRKTFYLVNVKNPAKSASALDPRFSMPR